MGMERAIKIAFDCLAALCLSLVLLPFWLLIAVGIKIDSPGPALFLHERPGYRRRPFRVLKFRTMRLGSEQMVDGREVTSGDERVTRLGRFLRRTKLDETPQLLNILRLEMSLVGPRPERMSYLSEYTPEELRRFDMRPGITGLVQVNGGIYLPLAERHRLDVYYVDHFSLWLDLRILLKTVAVVLLGEKRFAK